MNIKTVDMDNLPDGEVLLIDRLDLGSVLIYIHIAQRFSGGSITSTKRLMTRRVADGDNNGQELPHGTKYIQQDDLIELLEGVVK